MTVKPVLPAMQWVEIPEMELKILCGTPMDSIKHLIQNGFVQRINPEIMHESGPNMILLSDRTIQGGHFWNLSEFPILHMLFRQGMGIPGHPGNTGRKPMIVGMPDLVDGVSDYILRGLYGLYSCDEMVRYGVKEDTLQNFWQLKNYFAGGTLRCKEDLMDLVPLNSNGEAQIGKLCIRRIESNIYHFIVGDDVAEVNMNLPSQERWYPSYTLPYCRLPEAEFAVVHLGEGNGWDPGRPCMASLIVCGQHRYIIDAGPGIDYSLEHLGLDINEIDGVLCTHAHDDHFAGFFSLLHRNTPLKVFGTRPVIATIQLKCAALLGKNMDFVQSLADFRYLDEAEWNHIDNMQVRPIPSPHPIETSILFFRITENGKTYGHCADIISSDFLQKVFGEKDEGSAFSQWIFNEYRQPCTLKKIDVGRGMIHGYAEDFAEDQSERIILSHVEKKLRPEDAQYGSVVNFGDHDVLLPKEKNHLKERIRDLIQEHLTFIDHSLASKIVESPPQYFLPGTDLLENVDFSHTILFLISGTAMQEQNGFKEPLRFSPGALIGEEMHIAEVQKPLRCIAKTEIGVVAIPFPQYVNALTEDHVLQRHRTLKQRHILCNGHFPGYCIALPYLDVFGKDIEITELQKDHCIKTGAGSQDALYIIQSGSLRCDRSKKSLIAGDFTNIEKVIDANPRQENLWIANEPSQIIIIPGDLIRSISSLRWNLFEMIHSY